MKYLPENLKNYTLNLSRNILGENSNNLKYLAEGIK